MACDTTISPFANWASAGIIVNFDGSNICVRVNFFAVDNINNSIDINRSYPISTSDLDIASDLKEQFLLAVDSTYVDMIKRCFRIRELIFESLKY